jgi:hypothetical protein
LDACTTVAGGIMIKTENLEFKQACLLLNEKGGYIRRPDFEYEEDEEDDDRFGSAYMQKYCFDEDFLTYLYYEESSEIGCQSCEEEHIYLEDYLATDWMHILPKGE